MDIHKRAHASKGVQAESDGKCTGTGGETRTAGFAALKLEHSAAAAVQEERQPVSADDVQSIGMSSMKRPR